MIKLELLNQISQIKPTCWNDLLSSDYPFMRHEFLHALEVSECVGEKTGWYPLHLVMRQTENDEDSDEDGNVVAIMPLYIKTHSYGEYVFDWSWAEAYEQHGLNYYPKLLNAIPFTPTTGPRHASTLTDDTFFALLRQAAPSICKEVGASSWHSLFLEQNWLDRANDHQLDIRTDCQYHWFNRDYKTFDDFLNACTSRKRKNIKKERANINNQSIEHHTFTGEALTPELMDIFYPFYQHTYHERGRSGYLTLGFFQHIAMHMKDSTVLMLAEHEGKYVAGALYFKDSTTLYGRYWGAMAHYDTLHFETCYYQGIEYAIQHGIHCFNPGAQGEHKIARGFEPTFTHSAHWLAHTGLRHAVKDFLIRETELVEANAIELAKGLPFKKTE